MNEPGPFSGKIGATTPTTFSEIRTHIQDLLSDDYNTRIFSLEQLEKYGADAAQEIMRTMLKKASEPHVMNSLSEALEEIGKPSVPVLIQAFEEIHEIRKPTDAYLLLNLIETLRRIENPVAAKSIAGQLPKLNAAIKRNHNNVLIDICELAKVRIHAILADWNYSEATDDLHSMLGDGRKRLRDGLVPALIRFGDRRALLPLIRLYPIEESVSMSGAGTIRQAFHEIIRRHSVGESDPIFAELAEKERGTFEKLFPKVKAVRTPNS